MAGLVPVIHVVVNYLFGKAREFGLAWMPGTRLGMTEIAAVAIEEQPAQLSLRGRR